MKETCYFVDPGTHTYNERSHFLVGGLRGYEQLFECDGDPARIIVEATPSYMYSALALQELPKLQSEPHFIFILREPVNQLKSIYYYFRSNWDWIPDYMTFRGFIEASLAEADLFKGNELARDAVKNANYVDFLVPWREACGAGRIHVFLFEDVFLDQAGFMKKLARLLGVNEEFYGVYDFPRENATYSVRVKWLQRVNILMRSHLPRGAFYEAARTFYRAINTQSQPAGQACDVDVELDLSRRYRGANDRLAREFNLNLCTWNTIEAVRYAGTRVGRHKSE